MVVLLVRIPTLSEWNGYDSVGLPTGSYRKMSNNERAEIKLALKRKTIKEVAYEFNRSWSTIYKIVKEIQCGQNQH